MVIEMAHHGLDFIDILPLEVVEVIFQKLTSKDLVNCSLVSLKWREVINNNSIWAKFCSRERIHNKEHLQISHSHFHNPIKQFRPVENTSDRLSNICYWRSHYDRYKYLENNWRKGWCSLHKLNISNQVWPTFCCGSTLVVAVHDHFVVYSLAGQITKSADVKVRYPNSPIHSCLVSNDMLIYSQENKIIILRRVDLEYKEIFNINTEPNCNEMEGQIIKNSLAKKSVLILKRTEHFLVVLDECRPCRFLVLNINNGTFEREVHIEEGKHSHSSVCTILEVLNLKVYVAYSCENNYFVREYDLVKNEWRAKFSVPFKVQRLYVTQEILCAKLIQKRFNECTEVYIWSLKDMSEISIISVLEHEPIVLTNNVVVYCANSTVNVQSLQTTFPSKFKVPAGIIVNMFAIGKHLLVINTGDAIEVWDWGTGEKLYTPYRGICSNNMWVDEKMIIISRWSCNFQVIGYW